MSSSISTLSEKFTVESDACQYEDDHILADYT